MAQYGPAPEQAQPKALERPVEMAPPQSVSPQVPQRKEAEAEAPQTEWEPGQEAGSME